MKMGGYYWAALMDWLRGLLWKQEMEVCLVGLNGAGKTTLVNTLANGYGYSQDLIPTVGFNVRTITKGKLRIKLWDIGGQPRFRSMWERYCRGVSSIIFVVDAADRSSLPSSKQELHDLLAKKSLKGAPLLVLGNKIDLPYALSQDELISLMDLPSLAHREVSSYMISCKNCSNIDAVINHLIKCPKLIGS